jgi:serine/threonine protein kinase
MVGVPLCGEKCQKRLWCTKVGDLIIREVDIVFDEEYELVQSDPLSSGGYGRLYLAQRKSPTREMVAVKVFKQRVRRKYVDKEIRAISSLGTDTSPYVVKFFDAIYGNFRGEKSYMLVMEYIPGYNVHTMVGQMNQAGRIMEFQSWKNFAQKAFSGLAFLHAHGIAHRDVTPANIMVRTENLTMASQHRWPVLIDFNLSCVGKECDVDVGVLGSYGFVGPEGWEAKQLGASNLNDLFKATDVWGMTLAMIYLSFLSNFHWVSQDILHQTYDFTFELLALSDLLPKLKYRMEKEKWLKSLTSRKDKYFARDVFDDGLNVDWKKRKTAREMETLFLEL